MATSQDLKIVKGKTFPKVVRWEAEPIVYKPITGIAQTAPVRITCPSHGALAGWRAAVTNVKGMVEINGEPNAMRDRDYHPVTVVDPDTLEFNDVNAAGFKPYISGGYLQYNTPVDLTGFTARMAIKDKVGGTVLLSLTTENGGIVIDTVLHTITLNISAADTAGFTWKRGLYDLELVSATGVVTALLYGSVTVSDEITT